MAPGAGFEPATNWLTANCSTAELPRIMYSLLSTILSKDHAIIPLYQIERQRFTTTSCYTTK